jgi:hypothetical protein
MAVKLPPAVLNRIMSGRTVALSAIRPSKGTAAVGAGQTAAVASYEGLLAAHDQAHIVERQVDLAALPVNAAADTIVVNSPGRASAERSTGEDSSPAYMA